MRSVLTIFGIVWGIIAIMILLGWGFGFREMMWEGFTKIGEDLVVFIPGHTSSGAGEYRAGRPVVPDMTDVEAIGTRCPSVAELNPQISRWFTVKYGAESRQLNIRGVLPCAKGMNNWLVAHGRFITHEDVKQRRRFAFIGNNVREQLFGKDSMPVGEKIKINGVSFLVVGVAVDKKLQLTQINSYHNDQVVVPLTTALQLWSEGQALDIIFAAPKDMYTSGQVVKEIRGVLSERHHFDPDDEEALMVFEFSFFEKMLSILTSGLNILLGLVGIITLFIGGVGVMNVMFLSVQERTREIGVRKSVGARKRDIRLQFLMESLIITSLGGFVGFLVGSALLGVLEMLPLPPYVPLPQNSFLLSLIVIVVMMVTGVVSGYIPAKNAADMQPVQALQYERGEGPAGRKMPKPLWISRTLTGELVSQALVEIRGSKVRSFLTMFGIFWGIVAIILLMGFGAGFYGFFNREYGKMGEKTVYVSPGRVQKHGEGYREGRRIRFTKRDIDALSAFPVEVARALPEFDCRFPIIKYGSENRAVHTLGVLPDTRHMRNFVVAEGRFINEGDVDERRRVCFLGATIRERLFGGSDGVTGSYVKIDGLRYRVIGVARRKGHQLSIQNSLDDDKALIPITTAMRDFSGAEYLSRILISPHGRDRYEQCEKEIRSRLGRLHHFDPEDEDALEVWSLLEGFDYIRYIVLGLQAFLGGVGVVTLMIGAVGVMNIMFLIVTQRTREIGIRRAVGALKRHIFVQFLAEALVLTAFAGLLGFIVGSGFNLGLTVLVEFLRGQDPQFMVLFSPENSWTVSFVTVFFMVAAGLFAGLMPALRAVRLDIVESLRYE